MIKRLSVLAAVLIMPLLFAPPASADPNGIVSVLGAGGRVYIGAGANPKLTGEDKIEQQITETEHTLSQQFDQRSPLKGIYVINTPESNVTPDSMRQAFADKYGGFSGAIVVINSQGYKYRAYNVSKGWADNNESMFVAARDSHRRDLYGTITGYLANISHVQANQPPPAAPPPPKPADIHFAAFFTWLFGIAAAVGAAAAAVWGVVTLSRRRREKRALRDEVTEMMSNADADINTLTNHVFVGGGVDVSVENSNAMTAYGNARKAFDSRDYSTARAHLRTVQRQIERADKKLNPDKQAIKATPKKERVKARIVVDGVKRRNDDYKVRRQGEYRYYYPGGMRNDVYFYPGYYPWIIQESMWQPSDVVQTSKPLPDHWNGDYDNPPNDYATSYAGSSSFDAPSYTSSSTSSGGSSGFDSDSSSSSRSSYSSSSSSSSSYDSGGSSSSFGGFDSGGFSGGGGFDSGGGSSGF